MAREEVRENRRYYTIVGGTFRVQVPQDDPKAVRRDWTSADGSSSGTKYERIVNAVIGYIEDVQFQDGDYGMQIYLTLNRDDDGTLPVVALSTASREGEDLMKKLPNVNFLNEVRLRPYSFEGDGGEVRGMDVTQADAAGEFTIKVKSFFRDTEKKEDINGYPKPEGDTESYSKDDWKLYFLQARKFLVNYGRENVRPAVLQAVEDRSVKTPRSAEQEQRIREARVEEEEIDIDSIPF